MKAQLRAAEEESDALPKEIHDIKTALDRETAELQRQESGQYPFHYPVLVHPP